MSHEGIRCVVMSHKGVWSEACSIVCNGARNEDVICVEIWVNFIQQ